MHNKLNKEQINHKTLIILLLSKKMNLLSKPLFYENNRVIALERFLKEHDNELLRDNISCTILPETIKYIDTRMDLDVDTLFDPIDDWIETIVTSLNKIEFIIVIKDCYHVNDCISYKVKVSATLWTVEENVAQGRNAMNDNGLFTIGKYDDKQMIINSIEFV